MDRPFSHSLLAFILFGGLFFGVTDRASASPAEPPDIKFPLPSLRYDHVSYEMALKKDRDQCDGRPLLGQGGTGRPCRWWHDYVGALDGISSNSADSCKIFSDLADQSSFPLWPMALIHEAETCTGDQSKEKKVLSALQDAMKIAPQSRWLKGELALAVVKAGKTAGSSDTAEAELILQALPLLNSSKVKVQLLEAMAPQSDDLQHALYQLAPRLNRHTDDWWAAGMDAVVAHDYGTAIKAFRQVVRSTKYSVHVRRLAYNYLKSSYKAVQDRASEMKIASQLFGWDVAMLNRKKCPVDAPRRVLSSGLSLARFDWTEHKTGRALSILKQLQKILKNKISLGDVFYIRARIAEESGKNDRALFWMKQAVAVTPAADTQAISQYQWGYAWLNYKMGFYGKTQSLLGDLSKTETDPGKLAQQRFWLAKAMDKLEQKDQARALWSQIIDESPLSYYALLSYKELGRTIPPPGEEDMSLLSKIPRPLSSQPALSNPVFDWLVSVGELRMAQEALEENRHLADPPTGTPPTVPTAAENSALEEYARAQDFAPVFSHVFHYSPAVQKKIFSEHPNLVFPKSYDDFVNEGAGKSGLWPEYIFSIMRQESGFDPLSVSDADAYGLLQILPSVAKTLEAQAGVKISEPQNLLDPHENILLGAELLRDYWEKFDGQFILTTAAYNASPESVQSWVKTRYQGDPLVFIEDIPYEETRTYVKLVFRNFVNYLRIDSGGQPITFPEWCLEGIQAYKN